MAPVKQGMTMPITRGSQTHLQATITFGWFWVNAWTFFESPHRGGRADCRSRMKSDSTHGHCEGGSWLYSRQGFSGQPKMTLLQGDVKCLFIGDRHILQCGTAVVPFCYAGTAQSSKVLGPLRGKSSFDVPFTSCFRVLPSSCGAVCDPFACSLSSGMVKQV